MDERGITISGDFATCPNAKFLASIDVSLCIA